MLYTAYYLEITITIHPLNLLCWIHLEYGVLGGCQNFFLESICKRGVRGVPPNPHTQIHKKEAKNSIFCVKTPAANMAMWGRSVGYPGVPRYHLIRQLFKKYC